jgi:anti-sigma factor ChrR (cupin superfamily)
MRSSDLSDTSRILLRDLFGPAQDFSSYAWQPFREGIEIARIYGDGKSGPAAALLRYAAGSEVPSHVHTGFEHIVVLSGSQRDERGTYGAGSVLIHAKGTAHRVASPEGCVVLALWYSPVAFR